MQFSDILTNIPAEQAISPRVKQAVGALFPGLSSAQKSHTFRQLEFLRRISLGDIEYFFDQLSAVERANMSRSGKRAFNQTLK